SHVERQAAAQQRAPATHLVAGAAFGLQVEVDAAVGRPQLGLRGRRITGAHAGIGRDSGRDFLEQGHAGQHFGPEILSYFVAIGSGGSARYAGDVVAQPVVAGPGREQKARRQLVVGLGKAEAGASG
nr:hypothetical protein [Tanacetum cinerariifolium]